jgi:hypothetical protein
LKKSGIGSRTGSAKKEHRMKRTIIAAALALLAFSAWAQADDRPQVDPTPTQVFVFGPRVGFGWSMATPEQFTADISSLFGPGPFYPYYSIFGLNLEYRVLLGQSRDHFAIQSLVFLFGVEQSLFLPAGAVLLGYRHHTGFEFGVGPVFNPDGVGVIAAIGFTLSVGGVNIPFDVSYQIPNNNIFGALAFSTGFNFNYDVGYPPTRRRLSAAVPRI